MTTYTIHHPSSDADEIISAPEKTIFIKEGFSWSALVTQFIWLICHRLWIAAVLYIALFVAVVVLVIFVATPEWRVVVIAALAVLFAFEANDIRRFFTDLKGYKTVGLVFGGSFEECENKFFLSLEAGHAEPQTSAAATRPVSAKPMPLPERALGGEADTSETAIGLFPKPGT